MNIFDLLLTKWVKIPVADADQAVQVQQALFSIGCGYHNGSRLCQRLEEDWDILALSVTPTGAIGCFVRDHDEQYYETCDYAEILPSLLLSHDLTPLKAKLQAISETVAARKKRQDLLFNVGRLDSDRLTDRQIELLELILAEERAK